MTNATANRNERQILKPLRAKPAVKLVALLISVAVFTVLLFFPLFKDPVAANAFAILILAAALWMTEAIPLAATALLIPVLAISFGILPAADSVKEFVNPVVFLFMGGFVLAGALSSQSLDKMLAQKLIGLAHGNFYRSAILLMLCTSLVACWIGNTSSTAMMIPLALGLVALANGQGSGNESKFLLLGIAYSANVGGVITMISTPPNAIGAAILKISFSQWLTFGVPLFLLTFPVMILIMTLFFRPDRKLAVGKMVVNDVRSPFKNRLIAIFVVTVALWMFEGLIAPLLGVKSGFNAMVAILAIVLLYVSRVMDLTAILSSIRWDVLLLFGGGLTLGVVVDRSGLGAILVTQIMSLSKDLPMFVFLLLIVLFSITLTEFMSNTASAALILPLLYTLAKQSHIDPMILVLPATFASSYGFMLPVGTPPNAMVFSTGLIPQKVMIRVGLVINLVFSIILTTFFYLMIV